MWIVLTAISVACLFRYRRGPNAVWGGATIGTIVGLVIAASSGTGFLWSAVGKSIVIGILLGLGTELVWRLSVQTDRRPNQKLEPCDDDSRQAGEGAQQLTTKKVKRIRGSTVTAVPPELLHAMQRTVKRYSHGLPCDEGDFQRVLNTVFQQHAKLDGNHASQLMTEYLELPVSFEPIWRHFTRVQLCWLAVAGSDMSEYEKAEAHFALFSLLDGAFPTPDKIRLLKEVLTERIVEEWLRLREKNLASAVTPSDSSEMDKTAQRV